MGGEMPGIMEKFPRALRPALNRSREKQLLCFGIIYGERQRAVKF